MSTNKSKDISSFRKTWDILSPMLYYYVAYNIAFILLAFIVNVLMNAASGAQVEGLESYSAKMQSLESHSGTINGIINGLAMLLGAAPLLTRLKSQLYRNRVLFPSEKLKPASYLITVVIAITSSVGLNILLILTGLVGKSESYQRVAERQYGVAFGIGLFLYGVISPLVEEVVFRGLVYNRMKKYYPTVLAAIVSAVLFGASHGNLVQAFYGTCMGILLAYSYEKFNDFKIPCLFHAAANISVYIITYSSGLYAIVVRWYNGVMLLAAAAIAIYFLAAAKKE